jgi:hypothetical protein
MVKDPAECEFVIGGMCLFEARLCLGYTLIHKAPQPEHGCQHRSGHQALIIAGPDRVPLILRRNGEFKHPFKAALGLALFPSIMQSVAGAPISELSE